MELHAGSAVVRAAEISANAYVYFGFDDGNLYAVTAITSALL